MITKGWFLREVLKKEFVPNSEVCSQSKKDDFVKLGTAETRMDNGFQRFVPNVPNVPTKKESPCVLSDSNHDLEKIRAWLFKIGESEEDHHLVLNKCKSDPEAMTYYLRHAQGEFIKPTSATSDSPSISIGNRETELRIIRSWLVNGGRPRQDYLFRLIVEKCENDSEARAHFLRQALADKERKQSIVNEKVVPLNDHDDRVRCGDCMHLSDGHCREWRQTNPGNQRYKPMKNVLRRCGLFKTKEIN